MTPAKAFAFTVGLAVSVFFIWLVLRAVPLEQLKESLPLVRPEGLLIAVLAFGMGYTARIARWRLMLLRDNPDLSWSRCAVPFMASIAANNVLPFRAGDALRVVAFSKWLKVPTLTLVTTLLVERLLDMLILLMALGLGLFFMGVQGMVGTMVGSASVLLISLAVGISAVVFVPHMFEPLARGILHMLRQVLPSVANRLQTECDKVFQSLKSLAQPKLATRLLALSVVAWSFEAAVFYAVAKSIPGMLNPAAAWLAMPVGTLSTLLPSTPGYVGTFHYFVAQAAQAYGNDAVHATLFAILTHLVLWLSATAWGCICFLRWILIRPATSHHKKG